MAYSDAAWSYWELYVIICMIFCLSSVVYLLQIKMSPFFYYSITDLNIGFHRTIGIFLLNEIDSYHSWPLIWASLIEHSEISFFIESFQAKEYESWAESRMIFDNLKINFIKGFHKQTFIMGFNKITFFIVLSKFGEESSKLYALVSILNVFE